MAEGPADFKAVPVVEGAPTNLWHHSTAGKNFKHSAGEVESEDLSQSPFFANNLAQRIFDSIDL